MNMLRMKISNILMMTGEIQQFHKPSSQYLIFSFSTSTLDDNLVCSEVAHRLKFTGDPSWSNIDRGNPLGGIMPMIIDFPDLLPFIFLEDF